MSSTLCPYPYEDDVNGLLEVWFERKRKARKGHRCCECGETIEPGTEYGWAKGLSDGLWWEWKRCPSCLILAELVATVTGQCPLWEGLGESVCYANDELPEGATKIPSPTDFRKKWEADGER